MSNDVESQDTEKLSGREFLELIVHLSDDEILLTDCCITDAWVRLITKNPKKGYDCNLCKNTIASLKNVKEHLEGKRHRSNATDVLDWYHPQYTGPKRSPQILKATTAVDSATTQLSVANVSEINDGTENKAANENANAGITTNAATTQKVDKKLVDKAENTENTKITPKVSAITVVTTRPNQKNNARTLPVLNATNTVTSTEKVNAIPTVTSIPRALPNVKATPQKPMAKVISAVSTTPAAKPIPTVTTTPGVNAFVKVMSKQTALKAVPPAAQAKANVKPLTKSNALRSANATPVKQRVTTANSAPPTPVKHEDKAQYSDACLSPERSDDCFIVEKNLMEIVISDDEMPAPEANKTNTNAPTKPHAANANLLINPYAKNKLAHGQQKQITNVEKEGVVESAGQTNNGEDVDVILIADQSNAPNTGKKPINTIVSGCTNTQKNKPRYQSNFTIAPRVPPKTATANAQPAAQLAVQEQTDFSTKVIGVETDVQGLVGVEYVVKIMRNRSDVLPTYECGLCKVSMDGMAMQNHLIGYNHRLKYCEKHFPTVMRHYRQYMTQLPEHEVFKVMTIVLQKLAMAIEQHHGRNLPFECKNDEYFNNRSKIMLQIFSCRHASENNGPSFTHVVDSKEIDVLIELRNQLKSTVEASKIVFDDHQQKLIHSFNAQHGSSRTRQPSRGELDLPPVDNETHKQLVEQFLKGTGHRSESAFNQHKANANYGDYTSASKSYQELNYAQTQQQAHFGNYVPNAGNTAMDYARTAGAQPSYTGAQANYSGYPAGPATYMEHHSQQHTYHNAAPHESAGRETRKRQRSHSPTPTPPHKVLSQSSEMPMPAVWQKYQKMVDLKTKELKKLYTLYKQEPEAHPLYKREWQKYWKLRKEQLIANGIDHTKYNYQPEWVRYFEERIDALYNDELEALKLECREALLLPMTNESKTWQTGSEQLPSRQESKNWHAATEQVTNCPLKRVVNETLLAGYETKNTDDISVVSVLRLLAALEEHLGVLGPKIVGLLSKTLQLEKASPENIQKELFNIENCTLLETAKEKFKGLIIAGFLDASKERALKKAVEQTEALLEMIAAADKHAAAMEASRQKQNNTTGVPTEAIKPVDNKPPKLANNKELAMKLANTLSAQGKTNIDQDNLQQVIAVYTLLLKKQQEAAATSASTSQQADTTRSIINTAAQEETSGGNRNNANDTHSYRPHALTYTNTGFQQQPNANYNTPNPHSKPNAGANANTRYFPPNAYQNAQHNRANYHNADNSSQINAQRRFNANNANPNNQYQSRFGSNYYKK